MDHRRNFDYKKRKASLLEDEGRPYGGGTYSLCAIVLGCGILTLFVSMPLWARNMLLAAGSISCVLLALRSIALVCLGQDLGDKNWFADKGW